MPRRIIRESHGTVVRIAPIETGALAQCALCPWGRFFPDRKRLHYSAMARAAASLRAHNKTAHPETRLHISTAEEIAALGTLDSEHGESREEFERDRFGTAGTTNV